MDTEKKLGIKSMKIQNEVSTQKENQGLNALVRNI